MLSDEFKPNILVGTCGWSYYDDWKNNFYPEFLKKDQLLDYYCKIFHTVEIDSSFYHLPSKKTTKNWSTQTPKNFKFSAKIPNTITHKAKLDPKLVKEPLLQYFQNFAPLEIDDKMISHLIQLPPSISQNNSWKNLEFFFNLWNELRDERGEEFCEKKLKKTSYRPIVEFRNKSWINEKTFDLLREYNIGYCVVIEPLIPPIIKITRSDIIYIRFHGYGKKPWWNYNFSDEELENWAKIIKNSKKKNRNALHVAYFNNHFSGYAVKNALDILPKINLAPINKINEVNSYYKSQNSKKKRNKKENTIDKWIY